MIRHVVLWKLSSKDPEERRDAVAGMRQRLGALFGVVPGLLSVQVLADLGSTEDNWDVMLVSEHDDEAALGEYQVHPAHLEAAEFVRTVVEARAAVDAIV